MGFLCNQQYVRVQHIPTGICVICNESRSNHKNFRNAMAILRAKVHAIGVISQPPTLVRSYDLPDGEFNVPDLEIA
jgi:hypothetical protein